MKQNILFGLIVGAILLFGMSYGAETVACFGDSIISGYGIGVENTYCTHLNETPEYETYNYGTNGDKTTELLSRMSDVIGKNYNQTILLIGTNDLFLSSGTNPSSYYSNLLDITQQILDDGQTVLISTIPPCNIVDRGCAIGYQRRVILRNNIIRKVSYDNNICYSDIFSDVFGSVYDATQYYNEDGRHPSSVSHDSMNQTYHAALSSCEIYDCDANPNECYNPNNNKIRISNKLTIRGTSKITLRGISV